MSQSRLMQRFYEITGKKYDFLRLSSSTLDVGNNLLTLTLIYPYENEKLVLSSRNEIEHTLIQILALQEIRVECIYKKSYFDAMHFISQSLAFFSEYPAVYMFIGEGSFAITGDSKLGYNATITVESSILSYINDNKIKARYCDFLATQYCSPINIEFKEIADSLGLGDIEPSQITSVKRQIVPKNITAFIGEIAGESADFIDSIKGERAIAVLCGRINYFTRLERKIKTGIEYKDSFYKWQLSDVSGSINCIFFPTKNSYLNAQKLSDDKYVICSGEIKTDSYKERESLVFHVRRISYCEMPDNIEAPQNYRQIPKSYSCVFPKKCFHSEQLNALGRTTMRSNPEFLGNKFVVFDLETTGLSADNDQIIEIGAVKIENGKICEEFSTFIRPDVTLSEKIIELTGITDDMLQNAPQIHEVIGDFALFVNDCTLIAHNLPFDSAFITKAAKASGYKLPLKRLDTIDLARRLASEVRSHSLSSLTKHFAIENKGAHRAVYDARATAELFLKLVDRLKSNQIEIVCV